jgi:hypothetical protein
VWAAMQVRLEPADSGGNLGAGRALSLAGGVRERGGRLAADDRRGLVDELVILECLHHEEREVDAAREVAFEDWVTNVPAPYR